MRSRPFPLSCQIRLRWMGLSLLGPLCLVGCGGVQAPPYSWDWSVVPQNLSLLLVGLELTLLITLLSAAFGILLGIPVALGRLTSFTPLRLVVTAYIELWRGTPVLVQLVWIFYVLPIVIGVELPAIASAIVALALNMSAFTGEAFRSGIQAIAHEQIEAADILGLGLFQRLRYVIVPQAFRIVLPVIISLCIGLFKDSSLVSVIGVSDLMYNGNSLASSTYRPIEVLSAVAVIYFAIAFPFTILMRNVELRLSRHLAR